MLRRKSRPDREKITKAQIVPPIQNTYNNCVFGQPFVVPVPQGQQQPESRVTIPQVIEYVTQRTGLNSELVERVIIQGQRFIAANGKPDDINY